MLDFRLPPCQLLLACVGHLRQFVFFFFFSIGKSAGWVDLGV